jgi:hypothetical protein
VHKPLSPDHGAVLAAICGSHNDKRRRIAVSMSESDPCQLISKRASFSAGPFYSGTTSKNCSSDGFINRITLLDGEGQEKHLILYSDYTYNTVVLSRTAKTNAYRLQSLFQAYDKLPDPAISKRMLNEAILASQDH